VLSLNTDAYIKGGVRGGIIRIRRNKKRRRPEREHVSRGNIRKRGGQKARTAGCLGTPRQRKNQQLNCQVNPRSEKNNLHNRELRQHPWPEKKSPPSYVLSGGRRSGNVGLGKMSSNWSSGARLGATRQRSQAGAVNRQISLGTEARDRSEATALAAERSVRKKHFEDPAEGKPTKRRV